MKLLALILTTLTVASVALQAAPVSYPLLCRGSNSSTEMMFKMSGSGLNLSFVRGSKPATQGLNPGECSWMDRAYRADEPNNLWQGANGASVSPVVSFNSAKQVTGVMLNPVSGANEMWLGELLSPDKYWVFEVYNSGKGYLWVTKAYRKQ